METKILEIPLRGRGSRHTLGPITGWTKVSPEDYEYLSQFRWYLRDNGYVVRGDYSTGSLKIVRMHREILGFPEGKTIDHINRDRADNRRENLRVVSQKENTLNTGAKKNSSSKYRGVCWNEKTKSWKAQCSVGGTNKHIGLFKTEEDAAKAVQDYLEENFGFRQEDFGTRR